MKSWCADKGDLFYTEHKLFEFPVAFQAGFGSEETKKYFPYCHFASFKFR